MKILRRGDDLEVGWAELVADVALGLFLVAITTAFLLARTGGA